VQQRRSALASHSTTSFAFLSSRHPRNAVWRNCSSVSVRRCWPIGWMKGNVRPMLRRATTPEFNGTKKKRRSTQGYLRRSFRSGPTSGRKNDCSAAGCAIGSLRAISTPHSVPRGPTTTPVYGLGWAAISGMVAFPTLLRRGSNRPSIRTRWPIPPRDLIHL
jgi:hypothetical protein